MASHVLIMAGGGGTRLWPASRKQRPKQFLPLLPGGETLLGATVARVLPSVAAERVWVVTAHDQVDWVQRAAPAVPRANIIVEPKARNTAPCIGLGALEISRRDSEAVLAVLPSDQFVADGVGFRAALDAALHHAAVSDTVGTVGIRPTAPETGFGYIELGPAESRDLYAVERFVEKPDLATAQQYLLSGLFVWNAGMFFFRADRLRRAIAQHMAPLAALLDGIAADPARCAELYPQAESVSFDYGIMERLGRGEVFVVPGAFGWSDVGAWSALPELAPADAHGNSVIGDAPLVAVEAAGNIVYSDRDKSADTVVAALGVSNLIIAVTDGAVLVMPKSRAQDVRRVVQALKDQKRDQQL